MDIFSILITATISAILILLLGFYLQRRWIVIEERLKQLNTDRQSIEQLLKEQQNAQQSQRQQFDQHQINSLKLIQDSLQSGLQESRSQISLALKQQTDHLNQRVEQLTQETKRQLTAINGEVTKQLNLGFDKTTTTFTNVMKRLTIIDEAQKKITELSSNVVSLQEILNDKKSRGAFGEVQLKNLIANMIPPSHYSLQHTLSNGKRVDCMLFLPEPTGNVAIDSKFPLEIYRQVTKANQEEPQKREAEQQFRIIIKKHIQDIASKYIIPGETSDGALMFIPAEAIFAEIHGHYPELVEYAHQSRVWLASPTTMMAILTSVRAVLKDASTKEQVHVIQEHLVALSKDFTRFQTRMDQLSKHIYQAQQDVEQVHKSSVKISNRFQKIEKVDLKLEN